MDFAGPIGFTLSRYDAYELYLGTGFRHSTTGASFYTGLLPWLSISGSYSRGTGINYSPPAALVPFLGNADNSSATMTLRPTSRLRLDETYFFSRLATRPGSSLPEVAEPALVYRNHLLRTRINYQFSKGPLLVFVIVHREERRGLADGSGGHFYNSTKSIAGFQENDIGVTALTVCRSGVVVFFPYVLA